MASAEARVQRLEDIEAIRVLKVQYAGICDRNYPADELAPLFTDDAVWDGGDTFGVQKGKAAIRQFFAGVSKDITFALHFMIGHTIDIDPSGRKATAHWYLWEPMTYKGKALFCAITYDDELVKVDGKWLFSKVKIHMQFLTSYEKGWVKERIFQG